MKTIRKTGFYGIIILLLVQATACAKTEMDLQIGSCSVVDEINAAHPKGELLQSKLDEIVDLGVPGMTIAVKDANGTWASAAGFAKIETQTPLEICHLQFGQSVAKTYMATAILMLYEDGLIDLDENIAAYLPASVIDGIANAEEATVRMLLNHTSGIAEYNDHPEYVTFLLQNPLHTFSIEDYLGYVKGASSKFPTGQDYSYTNTNYILLALIGDEITGDHKRFIREEILAANNLTNSFYHNDGFMEMPGLVNTYWDRYSNEQIENCSDMHRTNVGSLIGDDGIIATPVDYVSFLELLLTDQLLEPATMDEMLAFVQKAENDSSGYGLGVGREFYDGHEELGHTGGGIGAGCILGYFPDSDTYYFIGMNLGVSIQPGIADPLEDLLNEVYDVLLSSIN